MTHQDRTSRPSVDGPDLMTPNEAARILGQPVEIVFRSIMCGRLPVVWVGPRPYVDADAMRLNGAVSDAQ